MHTRTRTRTHIYETSYTRFYVVSTIRCKSQGKGAHPDPALVDTTQHLQLVALLEGQFARVAAEELEQGDAVWAHQSWSVLCI